MANALKFVGQGRYREGHIARLVYENPGFIIRELEVDGKPDDYVEMVTTAEHGAVDIAPNGDYIPMSMPTPFSVGRVRCLCGAVVMAKDNMMELDMAFSTHVAYPEIPLPEKPRVARINDDGGPQYETVDWLSVNAPIGRGKNFESRKEG